jgi:predicted Rossmann fold nucleotide-binding protein DprA/Smf involved in DNA uptake
LKKGGIESTSKTFTIVVRNTLHQLKAKGKTLLFDDGWALAEWYPEGLRSRVEQKNKVQEKKRGSKKKTKVVSQESKATRPKALMENYFSTHQGTEISAKELAKYLGLNASGVTLVLSQMARKGWLEKTDAGKFRRSSKVTPISKTA